MGYELNSPQYFEYIHIFIKIFKLANINFLNLVFSIPKSTCPAEVSIIWWGQQCEFIKFLIFFDRPLTDVNHFRNKGRKPSQILGLSEGNGVSRKIAFETSWPLGIILNHSPQLEILVKKKYRSTLYLLTMCNSVSLIMDFFQWWVLIITHFLVNFVLITC